MTTPQPKADALIASEPRAHPRPKVRKFVQRLTALFLLSLGMVQAGPGLYAVGHPREGAPLVVATVVWTLAAGCLTAAGLGVAGVPEFARPWRVFAGLGAQLSIALVVIAGFWDWWQMASIDGILIFASIVGVPELGTASRIAWPLRALGWMWLLYVAAATALSPWMQRWGSTLTEIKRQRPGDERLADRRLFIDHAVDVATPPEFIWPWLVQIGQDRGGFYSYDGLERLFGLEIRNARRIHLEWQTLRPGDLVRACPRGWLGGVLGGNEGWPVTSVEPNRGLTLAHWGAFWIDPTPDGGSRLGIRSQVEAVSGWYAPIHAYLFVPVHFVMEQRMLRTIGALAERSSLEGGD